MWTRVTIDLSLLARLEITMLDFAILDIIYKSQTNSKYASADGYCLHGARKLANTFNVSKSTITNTFVKLEKKGLLEFNQDDNRKKRASKIWINNVQGVPEIGTLDTEEVGPNVPEIGTHVPENGTPMCQKLAHNVPEIGTPSKYKEYKDKIERKGKRRPLPDYVITTQIPVPQSANWKDALEFVILEYKSGGSRNISLKNLLRDSKYEGDWKEVLKELFVKAQEKGEFSFLTLPRGEHDTWKYFARLEARFLKYLTNQAKWDQAKPNNALKSPPRLDASQIKKYV